MTHTAYIGLGSNLGDKKALCLKAVRQLKEVPQITVVKESSWRETDPVGFTEQPTFINGVVEIKTSLTPHELIKILQKIENELGRKRVNQWGPRTVDLDILLYDDLKIDTEHLTIPHPRMYERQFVKDPLLEINPKLDHLFNV